MVEVIQWEGAYRDAGGKEGRASATAIPALLQLAKLAMNFCSPSQQNDFVAPEGMPRFEVSTRRGYLGWGGSVASAAVARDVTYSHSR